MRSQWRQLRRLVLLTGPKKDHLRFALNELKLGLQDSVSVDSDFVHTDYVAFAGQGPCRPGLLIMVRIRRPGQAAEDIVFIMLEKDKKKKSIFTELRPLMIRLSL